MQALNTKISNGPARPTVLAPLAKALHAAFGIEKSGINDTVPQLYRDQPQTLDRPDRSCNRAQPAAMAIIPTLPARPSVGEVLPALKGKLNGLRCAPDPNAVPVDLTFTRGSAVTVEEVNRRCAVAANVPIMSGVLAYDAEQKGIVDISTIPNIHRIFAPDQTKVVPASRLVRVRRVQMNGPPVRCRCAVAMANC